MSATRVGGSRVTVEDWDDLAPLSSLEKQSIGIIQNAANQRRVPSHLDSAKSPASRPLTPSHSGMLLHKASRLDLYNLLNSPSGSSRSQSVNSIRPEMRPNANGFDLPEPIQSTQQFYDWFARVEQGMERKQEEVYRDYLVEIDDYIETCELMLEQLDEVRGLLSEMEANYRFVEDNSQALQLACETMLDEQKSLMEVSQAITSRLEYFRELEGATRMLNLPGEDLILQEDFLNMLDRLDTCLHYLKENRDFRDAEIYSIRFQQCLTRSMTLIKMYFVSTMRNITNEVAEKMRIGDLSETASSALLYTKYSNLSPTLRILIFELENRGRSEPSEYGSLLQECYASWFASRASLLAAPLAEEVRRMEPASTDLIKLARAGCNHLRAVCSQEWALYTEFFSTGETEIYHFMESLCDYLYDSLRPRILHEVRLETLCELCTVINAMMAIDRDSLPGNEDDESDIGEDEMVQEGNYGTEAFDENGGQRKITKMKLGHLDFSVLLQTILQDSQTRLVFRAQAVIQNEIFRYAPTPADLRYPEKLLENQNELAMWTEDERLRNQESGGFRLPRTEVQVTWYPTLRRTIWVLSMLNSYVNVAIFEDFAGEAVTLCRKSLSNASLQISQQSTTSLIDGQLFLIRHLLLLKEMVRSVDLVQIDRAADFSTVTDAFISLLRNSSVLFRPNALFELASKGIPSFIETMTDAKMDLDNALKKGCEDLISSTSARITKPIQDFLDRCTTVLSTPSGNDLLNQPWASAEAIAALHDNFHEGSLKEVQVVMEKLSLYLYDEKTIGVLLPPLLDEICDTYTTFYNLIRSEYGFSTSSSLTTPVQLKKTLKALRNGTTAKETPEASSER